MTIEQVNQALHVYIRGPFGAPTSRVFQVFLKIQIQFLAHCHPHTPTLPLPSPGSACGADWDGHWSDPVRLHSPVDHAQVGSDSVDCQHLFQILGSQEHLSKVLLPVDK